MPRSYLDALSPGMRAKLNPLSRIVGEPGPGSLSAVFKNGADAARSKGRLWPIEHKSRAESRVKVTIY